MLGVSVVIEAEIAGAAIGADIGGAAIRVGMGAVIS